MSTMTVPVSLSVGSSAVAPSRPVVDLVQSRERFLGFLRRQIGDEEVAEEILQLGFARALEREEWLRQAESAPAWFYRLLRNAVVDHYRQHRAESRALELLSSEPLSLPEQPDSRLLADVCGCLLPLLDSLPAAYGDILRAVDLEDGSPAEYARAHGLTRNNATVRLHRARQALLERARTCCGTDPSHGCGCGGFVELAASKGMVSTSRPSPSE